MNEAICQSFDAARRGRVIWKTIRDTYHIGENDCLVILPDHDEKLDSAALRNLDDYLHRKYINRAFVIVPYEKNVYDSNHEFIRLTTDELNELIAYYKLVQFKEKLVVISMKEPFGNDGIIGKSGITLDDYIVNALYV